MVEFRHFDAADPFGNNREAERVSRERCQLYRHALRARDAREMIWQEDDRLTLDQMR